MALAVAMGSGACASRGDIEDLSFEMRAIAASQSSEIDDQRRLIEQLLGEFDSAQGRLRDQSGQMFDLRGGIAEVLREHAETLARMESLIGELQRSFATHRERTEEALARLAAGGSLTELAGGEASDRAPPGPEAGVDLSSALDTYELGVGLMREGSLATARLAFEEFLDNAPNHALASDAAFHLAHITYREGDSDAALVAFEELRSRFPTAARAPDALYQMALIRIEEGDVEEAIRNLELIVNTYVGTDIAQVAADKLAEIRDRPSTYALPGV